MYIRSGSKNEFGSRASKFWSSRFGDFRASSSDRVRLRSRLRYRERIPQRLISVATLSLLHFIPRRCSLWYTRGLPCVRTLSTYTSDGNR